MSSILLNFTVSRENVRLPVVERNPLLISRKDWLLAKFQKNIGLNETNYQTLFDSYHFYVLLAAY